MHEFALYFHRRRYSLIFPRQDMVDDAKLLDRLDASELRVDAFDLTRFH
jgi:hypothetical protein